MAEDLTGRVALITGASSGIGEATALALAAMGAKVAVVARRKERLDLLAQRIEASGGLALSLVADVSDEGQAGSVMEQTNVHFGRLDILVNNAGVMPVGPVEGADTDDWRRMIGLNLLGLMYCTHAALPLMKAQGSGHVVNMSSIAGRLAQGGNSVYCATKWGVGAFTEALRQEVCKQGIRTTLIEPGGVATDITSHTTDPEARKQIEAIYASINLLEAEDIADAVVWAVTRPPHVNVNEVLIRPTDQIV